MTDRTLRHFWVILALVVVGCERQASQASTTCHDPDAFERAICVMERRGDEDAGKAAITELAARGDRRAMSLHAGWYSPVANGPEHESAKRYARTLASEGDFVWGRHVLLEAINVQDAEAIKELRCLRAPSLTRRQFALAAGMLRDYPETTSESRMAAIMITAFNLTEAEAHSEDRTRPVLDTSEQLARTLPWLDADSVLFGACIEG